jgi:uncharacterized protein YbjT (DUF2867 family)
LIHSWNEGKNFEELDRISAINLREACIKAGVEKIIFLGGLGIKKTASRELLSRIETGMILCAKPKEVKTIWFRSGIIIGAGSSYDILINLIQKLPVLPVPSWLETKTQPIWIEDVLAYLTDAIDLEVKSNLVIDIGSSKMSFKEMLAIGAKVMGLKRYIVPFQFQSTRFLAYFCVLLTPVPFNKALSLVNCLKYETVVINNNALKYFPHIKPLSFRQSLKIVLQDHIE